MKKMSEKETKNELQLNMEAYKEIESDLLEKYPGKVVILAGGKFIGVYNDKLDAYQVGMKDFGEGNFSIKTIDRQPKSLGFIGLGIKSATV